MRVTVGPLYCIECASVRSDGHVNRGQVDVYLGRNVSSNCDYGYFKFEDFPGRAVVPSNAIIVSATLSVRVLDNYSDSGFGYRAFGCRNDWTAAAITWANRPADESVVNAFSLGGKTWHTINIAEIAQRWMTDPDYDYSFGLFIRPNSDNRYSYKKVGGAASSFRAHIYITYDVPASMPTLDADSYTLGDTVTVDLTVAEAEATHTIAYKIGDTTLGMQTLAAGVTSTTWTAPMSAGAQFPSTQSAVLTVSVTTTVDGEVRGTLEVGASLTLPPDKMPTLTSCSYVRTGQSQITALLQNLSGVTFTPVAAGRYGATIAVFAMVFEGITYTCAPGGAIAVPLIKGSGDVAYTLTITDSRGNQTTETGTVPVIAYTYPAISGFQIERVDASGTVQLDGERARAEIVASVSPIEVDGTARNTMEIHLYYRQTGAASWTAADSLTVSALVYNGTAVLTASGVPVEAFDPDLGYQFMLEVEDRFAARQSFSEMPTKKAALWFPGRAIDGTIIPGMAVGMRSTAALGDPKFEVAYPARFYDNVEFDGNVTGIQTSIAYTTGEMATGDTWIDGKPIYRYVHFGTAVLARQTNHTLFRLADMDTMISCVGTWMGSGDYRKTLDFFRGTTNFSTIEIDPSNNFIFYTQFETSHNRLVIVEYTKTTD